MIEEDLVESLADLFLLDQQRDKLLALPRWGEKKVDNLLSSIQKTRESTTLSSLLFAMAIPGVGLTICKQLSKKYRSLSAIMRATESTLREDGFTANTTTALKEFFTDAEHRLLVEQLQEAGLFTEE